MARFFQVSRWSWDWRLPLPSQDLLSSAESQAQGREDSGGLAASLNTSHTLLSGGEGIWGTCWMRGSGLGALRRAESTLSSLPEAP